MLVLCFLGGLQSKEVTADHWGVSYAPGTAPSISLSPLFSPSISLSPLSSPSIFLSPLSSPSVSLSPHVQQLWKAD